ncbi:hypothetical protein N9985_00095 [Gammaproteobacteria bacterium]|nr:hypothetical protein [Gammaproteobacteria bacterium]
MSSAHAKRQKQIDQYSGFEGNEAALGEVIVTALQEAEPGNTKVGFTGRELEVGLASSNMIKTMNSNSAYQHEMNDARVKMLAITLNMSSRQCIISIR